MTQKRGTSLMEVPKSIHFHLETSKPMPLFGSPYPPKNNNADELTAAKPCPSLLAKLGLGVALSSTRHNYSTTQVIKT